MSTPAANTPYWLLWSTGIVAFVLCIVAFVLWGTNGGEHPVRHDRRALHVSAN